MSLTALSLMTILPVSGVILALYFDSIDLSD